MYHDSERWGCHLDKLPALNLPVWMNKGEPLTLAHAASVWWERVYGWLTFPLAQIDADTCDEEMLSLLAYQRDIERFPGESLGLFRLRVKFAFVNAQDAGFKAGFERIFQRLNIGQIQQLERQIWLDWDVILIRINDEQLSHNNTLMMALLRQYGRTCRRYFFDVLNQRTMLIRPGRFVLDTGYHDALFVPTFEIVRFHVNGWMGSAFDPQVSFQGAMYTIEAQGAIGDTTWTVTGPASVAPTGKDCQVIIDSPGAVTVTGTDTLERTVTHTITPTLWFLQDGSKGIIAGGGQWANSMWGRIPRASEMTWGFPIDGANTQRGHRGSIWSEWGDMSGYGWPGAPASEGVQADYWITTSQSISSISDIYCCVLAGGHNQAGTSSNGTITPVNKTNPSAFRRCAVWDQETEFALTGCLVNGWYFKAFTPTTAFLGARYRLALVGHGGKPLTWTVVGPATITGDGWITLTGPGAITITGKNYRGETIIHTLNPEKYFIPSMESMTPAEFPAFIASTGGTQARNIDLTVAKNARGMGALWNEWGNMAVYGWPAVYPGGTRPGNWNASVSATSKNNTVYLTDGSSEYVHSGPDSKSWLAAVINIQE